MSNGTGCVYNPMTCNLSENNYICFVVLCSYLQLINFIWYMKHKSKLLSSSLTFHLYENNKPTLLQLLEPGKSKYTIKIIKINNTQLKKVQQRTFIVLNWLRIFPPILTLSALSYSWFNLIRSSQDYGSVFLWIGSERRDQVIFTALKYIEP
jgi:hypothetical protein